MGKLTRRARELRNNATDAERLLWQRLRDRQMRGYRFRRQQPIGDYIVDFVCEAIRLVVEVDGGQHSERAVYDEQRSRALEGLGYQVIRFWNNEVLLEQNAVLDRLFRTVVQREQELMRRRPSP